MRIRRGLRPIALIGVLAIVAGLVLPADRPAAAAVHEAALLTTPAAWPFDRLEIGFADAPGGATNLRADAPFGLRYQYLAGGVNTGNGWATWNTDGDFVKWYVQDSVANGMVAVFPYYQLLQSSPGDGQRRVREGPQQPQERVDDGRLLGRRPVVHAEGRGRRIRAIRWSCT